MLFILTKALFTLDKKRPMGKGYNMHSVPGQMTLP